ncbi:Sec-dependent nitrous-oxide reductase [bacterium]|nr:MAG: Sec-dependent nitrous-oxide reductase [bacterium]
MDPVVGARDDLALAVVGHDVRQDRGNGQRHVHHESAHCSCLLRGSMLAERGFRRCRAPSPPYVARKVAPFTRAVRSLRDVFLSHSYCCRTLGAAKRSCLYGEVSTRMQGSENGNGKPGAAISRGVFMGGLGTAGALLATGCNTPKPSNVASAGGPTPGAAGAVLSGDARKIAEARGLAPADVVAALKTYVPSGKTDEYYMFASGGHSGQVLVVGLPSMRLLKVIPVFSPESYGGWGFSEGSHAVLEGGAVDGRLITHGDTHHPAFSETDGDYDGKFVFINDKVNARVAVIDLRDFECKQIVKNPVIISNHGHCVTPNTEYVIETSQYAVPPGWKPAAVTKSAYANEYRGAMTFWKFDRPKGRIDPQRSFVLELPPYWQDLTDAGKLASEGWAFCNSINTELAVPEDWNNGPSMEISASRNDMDFLHVVNWKAAESLVRSGRVSQKNGIAYIPIDQAVREGLLYLVPEPKSPHGVDITPDGKFIVVCGKLDPHVSIYSIAKIKQAIAKGGMHKDPYGIPIVNFEDALVTQIKVGLGPLHNQFDDKGNGYTSLFLDSAVTRWTVGDESGKGWNLVETLPVQYNVGHVAAPHGDTVKPRGGYLVALNKWSLDRFVPVGPFYPRNLQLIDTSGQQLQLLYDMGIGMAEPHYAQIIDAKLVKPEDIYPPNTDVFTLKPDPKAPVFGKEGTSDHGDHVEVNMTVMRSTFRPDVVRVERGKRVIWRINNVETAKNAIHGFALAGHNISLSLEPGKVETIEIVADRPGTYPYYCTDFCSALHLELMGYFVVT